MLLFVIVKCLFLYHLINLLKICNENEIYFFHETLLNLEIKISLKCLLFFFFFYYIILNSKTLCLDMPK